MVVENDWFYLLGFIRSQTSEFVALATLVECEGSSYRRAGARLIINELGEYAGSLSGGCLEDGIAKVAKQVLLDGQVRVEKVNTLPHFGCPGLLTIQVEKVDRRGFLERIVENILKRETFKISTSKNGSSLDVDEGLIEVVRPRPRLIVVGWTSDQEPLFKMASQLHWECCRIVRDERMLKNTLTVSSEKLSICSADELSDEFKADDSTALLIMSHHMATDLAFLKAAAVAKYKYIGLLGSRRRREQLFNELGQVGLFENPDWLDSFYGPVGLDIGAQHPSSIALSILAEIQAVFSGSHPDFLSKKKGRIHQEVNV